MQQRTSPEERRLRDNILGPQASCRMGTSPPPPESEGVVGDGEGAPHAGAAGDGLVLHECRELAEAVRGEAPPSSSLLILFQSFTEPSVSTSHPCHPVPGAGHPEMETIGSLIIWSSPFRWEGRNLNMSSCWSQVTEKQFTLSKTNKKDTYRCA